MEKIFNIIIIRQRSLVRVFCMALLAVLFVYQPAFAEPGGGGGGGDAHIHIYVKHDYYVPYMPGADNCYGVYRVLSTRGYQSVVMEAAGRTVRPGRLEGTDKVPLAQSIKDHVGIYSDIRNMYRDDVMVFTAFTSAGTFGPFEEIIYQGNYVYHHIKTYYFEIPQAAVGYTADMSPIYGSLIMSNAGHPYTIAIDQSVIKKYYPNYHPLDFFPACLGTGMSNFSYAYWLSRINKCAENDYGYTARVLKTDMRFKGGTVRKGAGRYSYEMKYIISLNPRRYANNDAVGWWQPFAYETLMGIEKLGKRLKSDTLGAGEQFSYTPTSEDKATGKTLDASLMKTLTWTPWIDRTITYTKDAIDQYVYGTPLYKNNTNAMKLGSGQTRSVWKFNYIPTYKSTQKLWKSTADSIASQAKNGQLGLPWKAGTGILDPLVSSTEGFWTVPKAGMMENKNMSIMTNDASFLGLAPFYRAQADLYYRGSNEAPTVVGVRDPWDSMSRFLGINAGPNVNYLPAFKNRMSSGVFSLGALNVKNVGKNPGGMQYAEKTWNEPWLPGMPADGSIWHQWYNSGAIGRQFYKGMVPLMSLDSGFLFYDIKGLTAWNLGVERNRAPMVMQRTVTPMTMAGSYSGGRQAEAKSRGISDPDSYTTFDGETKKNNLKSFQEFNKSGAADFGSAAWYGDVSLTANTPMSVRYYPVDINDYGVLKKQFNFIGSSIKLPDLSAHKTLWNTFAKPEPAKSGVNLTPPVW